MRTYLVEVALPVVAGRANSASRATEVARLVVVALVHAPRVVLRQVARQKIAFPEGLLLCCWGVLPKGFVVEDLLVVLLCFRGRLPFLENMLASAALRADAVLADLGFVGMDEAGLAMGVELGVCPSAVGDTASVEVVHVAACP